MKKAQILKFGSIVEASNGQLCLYGFYTDPGDRLKDASNDVAILTLVIERLQIEIDRSKINVSHGAYELGVRHGKEELQDSLKCLLGIEL